MGKTNNKIFSPGHQSMETVEAFFAWARGCLKSAAGRRRIHEERLPRARSFFTLCFGTMPRTPAQVFERMWQHDPAPGEFHLRPQQPIAFRRLSSLTR